MHKCSYQKEGEVPQAVIVAYMPVRGGGRRHYLACSACDWVFRWPNYSRTSPVYEQKS